MPKKLAVIPQRCSGCRTCELVCAITHFGVNNPKKSCVRVMTIYPHPVIRMPVICKQCQEPKCADGCPVNAITRTDGTVRIDPELCISCLQCVDSCPFGAMFVHEDIERPFNCDLCGGNPRCVEVCPKAALAFVPEHVLGQAHRVASALNYVHMKEVEYVEKGKKRRLRYADIEGKPNGD